jgi:hypothetical protein
MRVTMPSQTKVTFPQPGGVGPGTLDNVESLVSLHLQHHFLCCCSFYIPCTILFLFPYAFLLMHYPHYHPSFQRFKILLQNTQTSIRPHSTLNFLIPVGKTVFGAPVLTQNFLFFAATRMALESKNSVI